MILKGEPATKAAGAALAACLSPGDIVTLEGPLGIGKTVFVRGLLEALGHKGEVPSPSFALVQPYEDLALPVWHADLYRLETAREIAELGLDTVLDDGALIIEWASNAGTGAFPSALALTLAEAPDGARRLTASVPAAWEGRCPIQ